MFETQPSKREAKIPLERRCTRAESRGDPRLYGQLCAHRAGKRGGFGQNGAQLDAQVGVSRASRTPNRALTAQLATRIAFVATQ